MQGHRAPAPAPDRHQGGARAPSSEPRGAPVPSHSAPLTVQELRELVEDLPKAKDRLAGEAQHVELSQQLLRCALSSWLHGLTRQRHAAVPRSSPEFEASHRLVGLRLCPHLASRHDLHHPATSRDECACEVRRAQRLRKLLIGQRGRCAHGGDDGRDGRPTTYDGAHAARAGPLHALD